MLVQSFLARPFLPAAPPRLLLTLRNSARVSCVSSFVICNLAFTPSLRLTVSHTGVAVVNTVTDAPSWSHKCLDLPESSLLTNAGSVLVYYIVFHLPGVLGNYLVFYERCLYWNAH